MRERRATATDGKPETMAMSIHRRNEAARGRPLVKADVFEVYRLAIDADRWRCDPVGEFANIDDTRPIRLPTYSRSCSRRQPVIFVLPPLFVAEHVAVGAHVNLGQGADFTIETLVWHAELEVHRPLSLMMRFQRLTPDTVSRI